MYKLIILSLIIPSLSFANCQTKVDNTETLETITTSIQVPKHLEGATITVRLKDGRESSVPAELFKVVPRKQERLVTKISTEKNTVCTIEADQLKNRVSILGGNGRTSGLSNSKSGNLLEVETNTGFVGGAQYQRNLTKRLSVGVQGQTNRTGSVLIGLDF